MVCHNIDGYVMNRKHYQKDRNSFLQNPIPGVDHACIFCSYLIASARRWSGWITHDDVDLQKTSVSRLHLRGGIKCVTCSRYQIARRRRNPAIPTAGAEPDLSPGAKFQQHTQCAVSVIASRNPSMTGSGDPCYMALFVKSPKRQTPKTKPTSRHTIPHQLARTALPLHLF
jgi:hypothetical protein